MNVKVIDDKSPEWDNYKDIFNKYFNPDDWDYMVIGEKYDDVLTICDIFAFYEFKIIELDGINYGVTYHG